MKNRVIIDFQNEDQAKKFFSTFNDEWHKRGFAFVCEMLALINADCIASTEEMPDEDYYMIEIE